MTTPPDPRRRLHVPGLIPARKGAAAGARAVVPFAIGHGYDIHRLIKPEAGRKLILAGVVVSEEIAPESHSDGDVILHAIVDAMLGALGAGDIGEIYGDDDPRWKNADSSLFVTETLARVRRAGYAIGNCDVTLSLERPKIKSFKSQMTATLRRLLDPLGTVNIKAGTNEKCDAVGRAEAVAAHAVVLLVSEA